MLLEACRRGKEFLSWVAKGRDIAHFTAKRVRHIEAWINEYPRRILNFMTPNELFLEELKAIS